MATYNGPDRRRVPDRRCDQFHLSDEDIDRIADRVEERFYAKFGRSILTRAMLLSLAVVAALWYYLEKKGIL